MLKTLFRALFVLRLESRQPALTTSSILHYWRTRPAIHYIVGQTQAQSSALKRKLDEVYPF